MEPVIGLAARGPEAQPPIATTLGREPGPLWMRLIARLVASIPYSWLRSFGAALAFIAGGVLRIRRRHVEAALRRAGIAGERDVARGMYRSLGAGLFELLWLAGRPPEALADRFEMEPACAARLREALRGGRGVVVATAHTGNWDLAACAAARWLAQETAASHLLVVTKRLSWRALDRYWQRLRAERGVVLVDAAGAAARVRSTVAAGGVAAMLIDQAPERDAGVAVFPFLGSPARHDLGPALLAARTRAPIFVILGHRRPDGTHLLELAEVIEAAELRGRDAVLSATKRIAAALERFVRAHPEQWLWLHRRWKGCDAENALE